MVGEGRKVTVGSWVQIRDGQLEEGWRIVPSAEADVTRRRIAADTPLARAVLGHQAGERVRVDGPEGRRLIAILSVE